MSAARALDNLNPTVHATVVSGHKDKRISRRDELANLWKPNEDDDEGDDYHAEIGWLKKFKSGSQDQFTSSQGGIGVGELDREDMDEDEVFDLLRSITDPEHPLTLEQLAVVSPSQIKVSNKMNAERVLVEFTPTIPHCSMATLIGLTLRVRLLRALPAKYKVDIRIKEGMHQSEHAVNKQLNDKERVQAALENTHLLGVVEGCLSTANQRGGSVPKA